MQFSIHKSSVNYKVSGFPRHLFLNDDFVKTLKISFPTVSITQTTEPDALNYDFLAEKVPTQKASEFKNWIKNYAQNGRL